MSLGAYDRLLDVILTTEDREKYEQFIGNALSDGPPSILVIEGTTASGKSTLLTIADLILKNVTGVDIHHSGLNIYGMKPNGRYLLIATIIPVANIEAERTIIRTTGMKVPVELYYSLVLQIGAELDAISRRCLERYRRSTENNQEN